MKDRQGSLETIEVLPKAEGAKQGALIATAGQIQSCRVTLAEQ